MRTLTLFSAYICILHLFNAIFANVIMNINEMVIDKIKEIWETYRKKKSSIHRILKNANPTV